MKEDFPLPLGPLRRMQTIRDNGGSLSVGQRKKLLLLKLRLRLEEAPVVILG